MGLSRNRGKVSVAIEPTSNLDSMSTHLCQDLPLGGFNVYVRNLR
jgi:hypothetical protein